MTAYFPAAQPACPTFAESSEWLPLLDGAAYFHELDALLGDAGPGDTLSIAGLELDPDMDLHGRVAGDPDHRPLGARLVELAARGVEVRVLLACHAYAASIPGSLLGGFRETALHADLLRSLRCAGSDPAQQPPLAGRVLLDHSGPFLGSNHQKMVVAHVAGTLTAFVGGIDLVQNRADATPHNRLRLRRERWGWHDAAVRLRGDAAAHVWDIFGCRWSAASTLPGRQYLHRPFRLKLLNKPPTVSAPGPAPASPPIRRAGIAVRVLRSASAGRTAAVPPRRRGRLQSAAATGIHEVFETLTVALRAATRYVYLEDQYLKEAPGGRREFELYPYLRAAAARGVKVILVGSGTRDPEEPGFHLRAINRTLNRHLRTKVVDRLEPDQRANVAVFRVDNLTVHSKLLLIDDAFACIGSANMFSRSMSGIDSELSAAIETSTSVVRDLRVAVWADHLRSPLTPELRNSLEELDLALGIWRASWSAVPDQGVWRTSGRPGGFEPSEHRLRAVCTP